VAYIDFSRAFDSIIHSKLLAKLSAYGVSGRYICGLLLFALIVSQCVKLEIVFLLRMCYKWSSPGLCFRPHFVIEPWLARSSKPQAICFAAGILFILFISSLGS